MTILHVLGVWCVQVALALGLFLSGSVTLLTTALQHSGATKTASTTIQTTVTSTQKLTHTATSTASVPTTYTKLTPALAPLTSLPHPTGTSTTLAPVAAKEASTVPQTPTAPAKTPTELNQAVRAALVNILCTTRNGGSFEPLSGSGVIITGSGVILTNAHVAQYFLLHDYPTPGGLDCTVRTGSPA